MPEVIDTHAHLGECCVFGPYSTEEEMIRRMDECGVDATIVQPLPRSKGLRKKGTMKSPPCAQSTQVVFLAWRVSAPTPVETNINGKWNVA